MLQDLVVILGIFGPILMLGGLIGWFAHPVLRIILSVASTGIAAWLLWRTPGNIGATAYGLTASMYAYAAALIATTVGIWIGVGSKKLLS